MIQFLAGLARQFNRDGYCFLLLGESARQLYTGSELDNGQAWTNADLAYAALQFDLLECPGPDPWSAITAFEDHELKLICDPLRRLSPERLKPGMLKELAANQAFTVDGLFFDPASGRFLDPAGCRDDLRQRRLRLTGPLGRFPRREASLLLRAIWLETEEHYEPGEDVLEALQNLPPAAVLEAKADLRGGLSRLLTGRRPFHALHRLDATGWLGRIWPELNALKGCPQDKDFHPEGDVFDHTLECFRRQRKLPESLALALLLHDIGKPPTMEIAKNLHFPGHSATGARMAAGALRRLGFSNPLIQEVCFYIRNHLLWQVVHSMKERELHELVNHRWFERLLRLYLADVQGSMGDLANYRQVVRRVEPFRNYQPGRREDNSRPEAPRRKLDRP